MFPLAPVTDSRNPSLKSVFRESVDAGHEQSEASNRRARPFRVDPPPDVVETTFIAPAGRKYSVVRVTTFPTSPHRRCTSLLSPVRRQRKPYRRYDSEIHRDLGNHYHNSPWREFRRTGAYPKDMAGRYLLPTSPNSSRLSGGSDAFDFGVADVDDDSESCATTPRSFHSSRRNSSYRSRRNSRLPNFKPAQPWPCRPCGLLLGTCHLLLGLSVIIFDVATNWITETVFAITAGICFVNSGIVGLIAARKLDRGSITLLVIFSFLSLGLSFVLIIECSAALNHACSPAVFSSQSTGSVSVVFHGTKNGEKLQKYSIVRSRECIQSVEVNVRAALLVMVLLESVVAIVSIFVGGKSLCNRYGPDMQNPSSPYHALIYGDLAPPPRPKRIVQDIGCEWIAGSGRGDRRYYSRLLLQYLLPSPGTTDPASDDTAQRTMAKP